MCVCACLCLCPTLSEQLGAKDKKWVEAYGSWGRSFCEKWIYTWLEGMGKTPLGASQFRWPTCRPHSVITLLSCQWFPLSRYEFWKTDIPALTPYAARPASKAELLITLLFCTPVSLTGKSNRTAFPDKPCIGELILGATHTQELGRGWRCMGIRWPHNSFLMVRFSHSSTSVVAVN